MDTVHSTLPRQAAAWSISMAASSLKPGGSAARSTASRLIGCAARATPVYVTTSTFVGIVDRFDDGDDSVRAAETTHNFQAWQSERGESHGKAWVRSPQWFRYDLKTDDAGTRSTSRSRATRMRRRLNCAWTESSWPRRRTPAGEEPLFTQAFEPPTSATNGRRRVAIMLRVPKDGKPRRTPRVF